MVIKINTEQVLNAFTILNTASYKQMDDSYKVKLWKIAHVMKPIAKKFEEDSKDAAEKLKEGFDGIDERLAKAKEYEVRRNAGEKENLPMTDVDYFLFINGDLKRLNAMVAKAVDEFAKKEVELDFEPISMEAFLKLSNSNDWTVGNAEVLHYLIVEN